jgi:hypothetical protein
MVRQAMVDPAALQATEATVVDLAVRRTTVAARTMAEAGAATVQLLIAHQATVGAATHLAAEAEVTLAGVEAADTPAAEAVVGAIRAVEAADTLEAITNKLM